jgi:hypothetical protein
MTDGSGEPEVVLGDHRTGRLDSTADAVEIELTKRSCSMVRFDTGDFPTRIRMAVRNGGVALAEGGQIWPRIGALDQMARASSVNAAGS